MTLSDHWILSIFIIRFQTREIRCQLSQTMSVQQNVDYFSQNNSSVCAQDTILFIFAAIILFYSISIHWTAIFFKARVHIFKKNVEVGRKRQELSFFVGDGLCRSDLIVRRGEGRRDAENSRSACVDWHNLIRTGMKYYCIFHYLDRHHFSNPWIWPACSKKFQHLWKGHRKFFINRKLRRKKLADDQERQKMKSSM